MVVKILRSIIFGGGDHLPCRIMSPEILLLPSKFYGKGHKIKCSIHHPSTESIKYDNYTKTIKKYLSPIKSSMCMGIIVHL